MTFLPSFENVNPRAPQSSSYTESGRERSFSLPESVVFLPVVRQIGMKNRRAAFAAFESAVRRHFFGRQSADAHVLAVVVARRAERAKAVDGREHVLARRNAANNALAIRESRAYKQAVSHAF